VRGTALSWLQSFLQDRKQYVSVTHASPAATGGSFTSDMADVNLGVPQGSILAPILFISYINDVIGAIDPRWAPTLFADDATFVISSSKNEDLEEACNSGVGLLLDWFSVNSLYLNSTKTTYLRFHTAQNKNSSDLLLKAGIETIPRSSFTKFLGLTIDENLNWKEHCRLLCGTPKYRTRSL